MGSTVKQQLQTLGRSLFADEDVHVHLWSEPEKGAPKADVKKAGLPPELADFYAEMDGFGIAWLHRDDWEKGKGYLAFGPANAKKYPTFDKLRSLSLHTIKRLKRDFPTTTRAADALFDSAADDADHRLTGFIRIPPLAGLLKDKAFAAVIKGLKGITQTFDGEPIASADLYARFRLLDVCSASEHAFLYTGPGPRHGRVHRMSSHYKLSEGDAHLPVAEYFAGVVAARGRVDARKALFVR